jgi:hypothetical protein
VEFGTVDAHPADGKAHGGDRQDQDDGSGDGVRKDDAQRGMQQQPTKYMTTAWRMLRRIDGHS